MNKSILSLIVSACVLFFFSPVHAENIDNFTAIIKINRDASINVVEKIYYDFVDLERHGIYRDIPIKYTIRGGKYNLRIDNISVTNQLGRPLIYKVSNNGVNKRIRIGDPERNITGKNIYVISYTINRAISFFKDYDELYWNITGNEWNMPISSARAEIVLPAGVEMDNIGFDCFTGVYGSKKKCDTVSKEDSTAKNLPVLRFSQDNLGPGEGLTVVVGFPKGILFEPGIIKKFFESLKDNLILLFPLAVFIILFHFWFTRGRDPKGRGTIIAQFSPPDNLTPAEVGTIIDERAHRRDISAEIINLAVKGYIKINREEKNEFLRKTKDYTFTKLKEGTDLKNRHEAELLNRLFKNSFQNMVKLADLRNTFYQDLEKIKDYVYVSILEKGYFLKNPDKVRKIYLILGIIIIFCSWFSGVVLSFLGMISIILSGALVIIFGLIMPARTKKGVLAKEFILGLKDYMSVAEKDRIKFHNAPEKESALFEKLLPFAMVLGVEKEWARQFEEIYKSRPSWYSDSAGHYGAIALANSLGDFQSKANATLASHPSSSGGSGLGGGGFSGGGFGGGGGGSW